MEIFAERMSSFIYETFLIDQFRQSSKMSPLNNYYIKHTSLCISAVVSQLLVNICLILLIIMYQCFMPCHCMQDLQKPHSTFILMTFLISQSKNPNLLSVLMTSLSTQSYLSLHDFGSIIKMNPACSDTIKQLMNLILIRLYYK